MNIRSKITLPSKTGLFGDDFLDLYGSCEWATDIPNKTAAHQFRTELFSRIATARLPYGKGVEKRALLSIVELFQKARTITSANVGCGTFQILVWHTLNTTVRPFTAKWHALSEVGALDALDTADDFRDELYRTQNCLRELERVLALLDDGKSTYNPDASITSSNFAVSVQSAVWRPAGGNETFKKAEQDAIEKRRLHYSVHRDGSATGIALSGGGIRSATFSLGVMAALARRDLLKQFDYLSTVSGGGYAGCFLTSLLGQSTPSEDLGLKPSQQPFKRAEGESELLMGVRQKSSFLTGGFTERLLLIMRSSYGAFVNVFLLMTVIAVFAAVELSVLAAVNWISPPAVLVWIFPLTAVVALGLLTRCDRLQLKQLNVLHYFLSFIFLIPLCGFALSIFHATVYGAADSFTSTLGLDDLSATLIVASISIALVGAFSAVYSNARYIAASVATVAVLLLSEQMFYIYFRNQGLTATLVVLLSMLGVCLFFWIVVDVNATSLYRYYRTKLATAFIDTEKQNIRPNLSSFEPQYSFYPIINCALNAPASNSANMRGRLADVFSFTPIMSGSNLIGYHDTAAWEQCNPGLDLAGMMALSGAAVAPQMGQSTTRRASFWLTLFNARLHAWLKKPDTATVSKTSKSRWRSGPDLRYLARELTATVSERLPFANVSDGGHIENLGVYELLRRRCRYILAVDGEADPMMTFHAITNLQRLAYIDFGIVIDVDLEELRLLESGLSRSHFRFAKIKYPTGDANAPWEIGYLLYVKLSLTGNEGEFLRRYRLDEPSFPHHSTADQFFTETQFEAYRSLGEHVGDKLFMRAILGEIDDFSSVNLDELFEKYADSFLDGDATA